MHMASPEPRFGKMDCIMARPTSFGRDTGLQVRMLITMLLLGGVYAALVGVLFASGASGITDPRGRRRPARPAVLHLRQARAAGDGRPRGLPAGGARAARDDRPPVRAGRPAQAEGRRHALLDAQRVRHGALPEELDRLRDDRDHGAAVARRARGRHGPRAHPRGQPRRGDHDARGLLRLAGLVHRAVRLLLRRRRRRRRGPRLPGRHPRRARGLRRVVLPHAGAVALPRVRRRPRRGAHHRAPERAVQRAA